MLKNKLKDTLKNKKGFTLAELLIVVAIIAILVAISVPIFTGKLESAKQSTDKANERAAKAAAVNKYLDNQEKNTYYYDAENGILVGKEKKDTIKAYGQSAKYPEGTDGNTAKGNIIEVNISAEGEVKITWVTPDSSATSTPTPTPGQ
ncbi:type II secretion system protein [Clostridium sp. Marseille-P299]|uniref:type II secretion system protein n=1 Tax=Clostridium sp. Marseille-P299 TaxID=1805477 RepID=UPI000835A307|nr:prepilin-type N-terminal cleavage/methylation domain-containing protein [Clostridium sp. Marseille-P299]